MKYCINCGKELFDEAVVCPGCGCATATEPAVPSRTVPKKKFKTKLLFIIIPASVLVITAGILAAMIFRKHDLKMKDFKDYSYLDSLFHYGIPDRKSDDGTYIYDDNIEFYGISPGLGFSYHEGESFVMFFNKEDGEKVLSAIRSHCDLVDYNLLYNHYTYRDLRLTVEKDGTYVKIEFR